MQRAVYIYIPLKQFCVSLHDTALHYALFLLSFFINAFVIKATRLKFPRGEVVTADYKYAANIIFN